MGTKTEGFNRNLRLSWLDAAAGLAADGKSTAELRDRLRPIIGQDIAGPEGRRKTIDVLVNVWLKVGERHPALHAEAMERFRSLAGTDGRLWLHYGLALLYYPLFREAAAAIGQLARLQDAVAPSEVKSRLVAQRGALGAVEKSVERVFTSLHDWGLLIRLGRGRAYLPRRQALVTEDLGLEAWLLACALHAHPSEELPFADLLRLPELFPFRFGIGVDDLRRRSGFAVQRQGSGWDTVRVE